MKNKIQMRLFLLAVLSGSFNIHVALVEANEVIVTNKLVPQVSQNLNVELSKGYGHVVDVSEGRIAVGYRVFDTSIPQGSSRYGSEGGAVVFELNTAGEWVSQFYAQAYDSINNYDTGVFWSYGGPLGNNGAGMSFHGDTILLGVPSGTIDNNSLGWIYEAEIQGSEDVDSDVLEELFDYDTYKLGSVITHYGDAFVSKSSMAVGGEYANSIRIFEKTDIGSWESVAEFASSNCSDCIYRYPSLSMNSRHIAAGAMNGAGTVDLYNFNVSLNQWQFIQSLEKPEDILFGDSVDLSGDTLVVRGFGRVTVYQFAAGEWIETAVIEQNAGSFIDGAVELDNNILAIGGRQPNGRNVVFVYMLNSSGQWTYDRTLIPFDSDANGEDGFGSESMSLENGILVVGRENDSELGAQNGSAYVYTFSGAIASPQPGAKLDGVEQLFTWNYGDNQAVNYRLTAGSAIGGNSYFDSGEVGVVNSVMVTGLPVDGSIVNVRLWYQLENSAEWSYVDYEYVAIGEGAAVEIESLSITRGILLDELKYTVNLSAPLPDGFGIFLNFDNQKGAWFEQDEDGGHFALLKESSLAYGNRYIFNRPGLRSVRAGIFELGATRDDDVLVGAYSEGVLCTERVCLDGITKNTGIGDPAVSQSGSQLVNGVDIASGNYHLSFTDLYVVAKGISFAFPRAYNSQSESGWSFGYEARVRYAPETFERELSIGPKEDGRYQQYFKEMDHLGGLWHALDPGNFDQLVENEDGSFTQYTRGNKVYQYAAPNDQNPEATGQLVRIEDRIGNGLQLSHAAGKLSLIIDENGGEYRIERDANGRITSVTDFSNRTVTYRYNNSGQLTRFTDARGYADTYNYDSNGSLKLITNALQNNVAELAYSSQGQVVTIVNAEGETIEYIYDQSAAIAGEGTGVVRPSVNGVNYNKVYLLDDSRRCVTGVIDTENAAEFQSEIKRLGAQNRNEIAKSCLVENSVAPNNRLNGLATSRGYTDEGRLEEIDRQLSTNSSLSTRFSYSDDQPQRPNLRHVVEEFRPGVDSPIVYSDFRDTGVASEIIDSRGFKTDSDYDNNDWLLKTTNALNQQTSYTHTNRGLIASITDALGAITTYEYDQVGRKTKETNPLGLVTTYYYDANDNVVRKNEAAPDFSYTITYEYDEVGNLVSMNDAMGLVTTYSYDAMNRVSKEQYTVNSQSFVKSFEYDALGRMFRTTDENNNTSRSYFNARNLVTKVENGNNEIVAEMIYDANGNVVEITDAEGRAVQHSYDALDRKISTSYKGGLTEYWEYDSAGRVSLYTDRAGKDTLYEYDSEGNLTKTTDANGGVTLAFYDGVGNLVQVKNAENHTTRYTYDMLNRRVSTILPDGESRWLYEYDANGNVTLETTPTGETIERQYDALNRVARKTERTNEGGVARQISYSYDANSNVILEASNGKSTTYQYDKLNRVISVTDSLSQTVKYGYDKLGNRASITYPGNLTVSYQYDDANRMESVEDWLGNVTFYVRNGAGQIVRVDNPNGTQTNYDYDDLGRLQELTNSAVGGSVISRHELSYDDAGAISSISADESVLPSIDTNQTVFAYDENNFIESAGDLSFEVDGAGRLVEEDYSGNSTMYEFGVNDLISEIRSNGELQHSFEYDLRNNRIKKISKDAEKRYLVDQFSDLPDVLMETDENGVVQARYIYGDGLISRIDMNDKVHFYHYNQTGHTTALSNEVGTITDTYSYTPYGETKVYGNTDNPFRFVGKYGVLDDENKLHYMRARYYKSGIARFLSLDVLEGAVEYPQTLNRYLYTQGRPIQYIDPSGLCTGTTGKGSCNISTENYLSSDYTYSASKPFQYSDVVAFANDLNGEIFYDLASSKAVKLIGPSITLAASAYEVKNQCDIDRDSCLYATFEQGGGVIGGVLVGGVLCSGVSAASIASSGGAVTPVVYLYYPTCIYVATKVGQKVGVIVYKSRNVPSKLVKAAGRPHAATGRAVIKAADKFVEASAAGKAATSRSVNKAADNYRGANSPSYLQELKNWLLQKGAF